MSSYKILTLCVLSLTILFFSSCGGGDEEVANAEKPKEDAKTNDAEPAGEDSKTPETPVEDELEEEEEVKVVPNPNGVYLPTGEERNGQPVYENQEGFSMWFDGSVWKITDKTGGGKVISQGKASINDNWQNGAKASFYPDEEYAKDATFRLAVAFQGSQDNKNAIRLF